MEESSADILKRLREEKAPYVNALVCRMSSLYGVEYAAMDKDGLENVVFRYKGKETRTAHEMFYRLNGRSVCLDKDEKQVRMTDEMFYRWFELLLLFSLGIDKYKKY